MSRNKGTKEGTIEEKSFTVELNKKDKVDLWKKLNVENDIDTIFAIHIRTKKFGKINKQKVSSKADVFLAKGNVPKNHLINKEFYLDENDLENYSLKPIPFTGISVKRFDSLKYQIMKISPTTFKEVFNDTELAAGASIYCKKIEELKKNTSVLNGWKTDWVKFSRYIHDNFDLYVDYNSDINIFKNIKKLSNDKIHSLIIKNEWISNFVFKGIGNFEEPYTATFLYEKGILKLNYFLPFKVTTGSGRSKGVFTIVLKPG